MIDFLLPIILGVAVALISLFIMPMVDIGGRRDTPEQQPNTETMSVLHKHVTLRLRPFMTWGYRSILRRKLRRAGLSQWTPEDLCAVQLGLFLLIVFLVCFGFWISSVHLWDFAWFSITGIALSVVAIAIFLSLSISAWWIDNKHAKLCNQINRTLPCFMDLISISLSAGLSLNTAFQFSTSALTSGQFKSWSEQILLDVETGRALCKVLKDFSADIDSAAFAYFVACVHQAETMGTSLARQLSDHAEQMREEHYMKVEKQSMQAPVKMLLPLAVCIFPCNFLVLGFPIVSHILSLT